MRHLAMAMWAKGVEKNSENEYRSSLTLAQMWPFIPTGGLCRR